MLSLIQSGRVDMRIPLNLYISKNGYIMITHAFLHRIVAILFIPNPHNKPCVDHIDGNKLNNRVDNLRWVTYSENMNNPITKRVHNSKEHNNKIGESCKGRIPWNKGLEGVNKNRIWIRLNNKRKLIQREYLDYYLENGWIYGYGHKNKES